jgi:hypothetical protein
MSVWSKIFAILFCLTLCAAGAIFSPKQKALPSRTKTKVLPIDNRANPTKIWLWA